jgi:hypothetical protein
MNSREDRGSVKESYSWDDDKDIRGSEEILIKELERS